MSYSEEQDLIEMIAAELAVENVEPIYFNTKCDLLYAILKAIKNGDFGGGSGGSTGGDGADGAPVYCVGLQKITPLSVTDGSAVIDLTIADSNIFSITLAGGLTTLSVSELLLPENTLKTFELHIATSSNPATPANSLQWFDGIDWVDEIPSLIVGKTIVVVFRTHDGENFIGNLAYVY
jgi:hypothetical protein